MRSTPAVHPLACAATLAIVVSAGASVGAPAETAPAPEPRVTRVFYLDEMETREALMQLRIQVRIRSAAVIQEPKVLVVSDVAEQVEQAESVLRLRDAGVRASDPHGPLDFDDIASGTSATRVFRLEKGDAPTVITLLRTIYQVREVEELEDGDVSAHAGAPVLDAIEALLRELDLLVEPGEVAGNP